MEGSRVALCYDMSFYSWLTRPEGWVAALSQACFPTSSLLLVALGAEISAGPYLWACVLRGHSGVGDVSFEFLLGAQRALMWGRLAAGRASRQAMSTALKYSALKYTAHQLLSESLPSFTEAIIYCKNTLFYFILF